MDVTVILKSCYVLLRHMPCYASVSSLVIVTSTSCYASVSYLVLVTHTSCYASVSSLVLVMHESCGGWGGVGWGVKTFSNLREGVGCRNVHVTCVMGWGVKTIYPNQTKCIGIIT